jgi:hypothetical protein
VSIRPIFFSAFAACTLLAGAASAEDTPNYFENEVLHFEVEAGVLVTTTTIEGVDVIMAQMSDPLSGAASGHSFVSISIYRDDCTVETCVERVLASLRAAFEGTATQDGNSLTVEREGVQARGEVDVHDAGGGTVVVTYAQFDRSERSPQLAALLPSLALGPVPLDAPDEEPAEAEGEDEHTDDHATEGGH